MLLDLHQSGERALRKCLEKEQVGNSAIFCSFKEEMLSTSDKTATIATSTVALIVYKLAVASCIVTTKSLVQLKRIQFGISTDGSYRI